MAGRSCGIAPRKYLVAALRRIDIYIDNTAHKFVIGTDDFIRLPGATVGSPLAFKETWPLLEQLPLGIREKIGRENAARIYNLH